ncbi:H-type small acid-soluble spore protein [Alkaliphilus crotonatoxidans]
MDIKRAEQIFTSMDKIPVQYQGRPIWIAALNAKDQTAQIKQDLFSDETWEVPVSELKEGK